MKTAVKSQKLSRFQYALQIPIARVRPLSPALRWSCRRSAHMGATISKLVICAVALCGALTSVRAADLDLSNLKAPPLPDTLTWKGITLYGAIDVGYGYQTHGLGVSSALYSGEMYNIVGNTLPATGPSRAHPTSALTENALTVSYIGVKLDESIGGGWKLLADLNTAFNPLSGRLGDACASLIEGTNALVNKTAVAPLGDGTRCGQAINGEAYAGVSNTTFGILKVGRQNTLSSEVLGGYDPQAASLALSLLGWAGAAGAGAGSTETARWDNSVKYGYQYGPIHGAVMYTNGGQGTANHGAGYAGSLGATYKGFSVEGYYLHENGAVNLQAGTLTGNDVNQTIYYLSNNDSFGLVGRYVFEFDGGTDKASSKFTVSGGYAHTDMTGDGPGIGLSAGTTIGGYQLTQEGLNFTSTRTLETVFFGGRYEIGPWTIAAAYYRLTQNSFTEQNMLVGTGGCSVNTFACAGATHLYSALVDYAFNKHVDIYSGVSYSDDSGGLAHSSLSGGANGFTENLTVVSGLRLKF
jgi:predicted porin